MNGFSTTNDVYRDGYSKVSRVSPLIGWILAPRKHGFFTHAHPDRRELNIFSVLNGKLSRHDASV